MKKQRHVGDIILEETMKTRRREALSRKKKALSSYENLVDKESNYGLALEKLVKYYDEVARITSEFRKEGV